MRKKQVPLYFQFFVLLTQQLLQLLPSSLSAPCHRGIRCESSLPWTANSFVVFLFPPVRLSTDKTQTYNNANNINRTSDTSLNLTTTPDASSRRLTNIERTSNHHQTKNNNHNENTTSWISWTEKSDAAAHHPTPLLHEANPRTTVEPAGGWGGHGLATPKMGVASLNVRMRYSAPPSVPLTPLRCTQWTPPKMTLKMSRVTGVRCCGESTKNKNDHETTV